MNKTQKLAIVFDFIAEYLREDETAKAVKQEPKIKCEEIAVKPKEKREYKDTLLSSNEGVETEHILKLMKRLDDMDKAKASAYRTLNEDKNLRDTLSKQINETRLSYLLGLTQEIVKEEIKDGSDLIGKSISASVMEKIPAIQELELEPKPITDEINLSPDVFTESETPFSTSTIGIVSM